MSFYEGTTLEQVIRQYVELPPTPSMTGWFPVLHSCDHGHKGKRAGFKFDGDVVAFHCFNCQLKAVFDPNNIEDGRSPISDGMNQVLQDFHVPKEEIQKVIFATLKQQKDTQHPSTTTKSTEPPEIQLPSIFYPLAEAKPNDKWALLARYYLEDRGIDPSSYPFFMSERTDIVRLKKWFGRVIIPIYKHNKLIFYIARDLTEKAIKKYESPSVSRESVIYGYDELFKHTDLPLYITEGWFDAFPLDGVALIGNEISDTKIEIINRSRRQKVYIPDQFGNGFIAAKTAIDAGWSVSTPDFGACKDVSAAVQKYGKMYVIQTLVENTSSGFEAELKARVYCKK